MINTSFPTKKAAEKRVAQLLYEWERPFCPLIKEYCNTDCICLVRPAVISYYKRTVFKDSRAAVRVRLWIARQAYCDNAMFNEHEIYQG